MYTWHLDHLIKCQFGCLNQEALVTLAKIKRIALLPLTTLYSSRDSIWETFQIRSPDVPSEPKATLDVKILLLSELLYPKNSIGSQHLRYLQ